MRIKIALILMALPSLAPAQDQWKDVYKEQAWIERDQWQRPASIIKKLGIKQGDRVADVGCHEGYMTVKLSAVTGPTGKIFAVDIGQAKLDKLKTHLEARKITNVISILGDPDNPKLPRDELDGVLILDTYHEMKDHDKILAEIRNSLKQGGHLVICEPIAGERRKLSREDQERKHELAINFALEDLHRAGFHIQFSQDPFIDREKIKGDKMWIIVAIKR